MGLRRLARRFLPETAQSLLRRAYYDPRLRRLAYGPRDWLDGVLGRRPPLRPPKRIAFVGDGDFDAIGAEFLGYFRTLGGLLPGHRVLDVGCGVGRMALPLTGFLSADGRYEGFDVVADAVRWCREQITPRFPNFRFRHSDVRNSMYNPRGAVCAAEHRFPFPDSSFDFVFLTSVLTHLLKDDLDHYVAEVARVLAPGRRVLATFFLMDEVARARVAAGRSPSRFLPHGDDVWVIDRAVPESAVAFTDDAVREVFARHGLRIEQPIHRGSWSGRADGLSFQDLVIAVRC